VTWDGGCSGSIPLSKLGPDTPGRVGEKCKANRWLATILEDT
jgi:hypothetical protein